MHSQTIIVTMCSDNEPPSVWLIEVWGVTLQPTSQGLRPWHPRAQSMLVRSLPRAGLSRGCDLSRGCNLSRRRNLPHAQLPSEYLATYSKCALRARPASNDCLGLRRSIASRQTPAQRRSICRACPFPHRCDCWPHEHPCHMLINERSCLESCKILAR